MGVAVLMYQIATVRKSAVRLLLLFLCAVTGWAVSAPVVTSGSAIGTVGAPFVCAIIATESPTHYDAPGLPAGLSIDAVSGIISGTPTAAGVTAVAISATNAGFTGTGTLTITITAVGGPLVTNASLIQVSDGSACSFQLTADATATGWVVSGLPAGLSVNGSGLISGTVSGTGTTIVTASADTGTTSTTLVVSVLAAVGGAPVFTLPMQPQSAGGAPFAFALSASSATGFSCSNLPSWLALGSTNGVLQGTPTITDATVNLRITATIGANAGVTVIAVPYTLPVTGDAVPSATAVVDATVGSGLGWQATASVSPATFTSSGFPSGLSLDSSSGILSGTPTTAATSNILLTADAGGVTTAVITTMVVRVQAATTGAPVIASLVPPSLTVGGPGAFIVPTTGATPTAFTLSDPSSIFTIASTGVITGTPTTAGSVSMRVTASTATASTVSSFLVTVSAAASGAPVPANPLQFSGTVGSAFASAFAASTTPTSWTASGLPTGTALAPLTGYVTGTPTVPGDANVPLSMSGASTSNQTNAVFRFSSATSGAPVITTAGPWFLTANQPAGLHFAASGSPTWSMTSTPTGLTLDTATGDCTGTPTTAATTSVAVTASEGSASAVTSALIIVESAVTGAPVFSLTTTQVGEVGTAFTCSIAASASPLDYTASPLPAGLTLNTTTGAISGTPTTAGVTTVQVSARNASGTTRTTIIIRIAAAASTVGAPGPAVSNVSGGCGASGSLASLLMCLALLPKLRRRR